MACHPEISVGGRLIYFLKKWEQITDDQWVLSVIKEGYKLEFLEIPKNTGIKYTCVSAKDLDILDTEENRGHETSNKLKTHQQVSPKTTFQNGFPFFGSQSGETRRLGNQSGLKGRIFTCPNLQSTQEISEVLSKNGRALQFKALPFGPTSALRVLTNIMAVVAAHLRSRGIRLIVYLDDWFLLNQEKSQLILDRELVRNLLVELGFIINLKKSTLDPSQQITSLGAMFLLNLGIVLPTEKRTSKLIASSQAMILQNQVIARDFLHFLGIMSSCLEIIPNARLHMKPVQIHLLKFWKPVSQDLEFKVPITAHLRSHLKWWLDQTNIKKGRSLKH
ncbi:uncharacterized protein LOC134722909 [Mytilus trossulus]|uniref:uncharacterized protein LOC134722909 n=1 Tax=Mytilus trossulus TaxID=6551 RepID=UPI0030059D00